MAQRVLIVALALALSLGASTPAVAAKPGALSVANAAWPGSPCAGKIRLLWDASIASRGSLGEASGVVIWPDGHVDRTSCDITIDPVGWAPLDDMKRCDVLVHEAGHLAGINHTTNGGVMDASAGAYGPCHPAPGPTSARDTVRQFVRGLLPTKGGTRVWRVSCARRNTVCVAQAAHTRTRTYVVDSDASGTSAQLFRLSR